MLRIPKQILFRDVTDLPNAAADSTGTPGPPTTAANNIIIGQCTQVQIDLTGVAVDEARASNKVMLPKLPDGWAWSVDACIEAVAAPTDTDEIELYWAESPSSAAATGNAGGVTGSDADFVETTGNLAQMTSIGSLVCRADVINIGHVGILVPRFKYGVLVVLNSTAQILGAAMDETQIVFTEVKV